MEARKKELDRREKERLEMMERVQKQKLKEASEKRKIKEIKIEKARHNQEELLENQRAQFMRKEIQTEHKLEKFKKLEKMRKLFL